MYAAFDMDHTLSYSEKTICIHVYQNYVKILPNRRVETKRIIEYGSTD